MQQNGWAFKNIGTSIETRSGIHDDKCGKDSWYGWKTPGSEGLGSLSAIFLGSGSAVLNFGNCHVMGTIEVFLSNTKNKTRTKMAIARANDKNNNIAFNFTEGTILNITTDGGIVKLNSLVISCKGNIIRSRYRFLR